MVSEIDEQSQSVTGRLQIVVHLSAMRISQFAHRFQFNDDLLKADEIRDLL